MFIQYMVLGFEPTTFGLESPSITTRPGLPPLLCGIKNRSPNEASFTLLIIKKKSNFVIWKIDSTSWLRQLVSQTSLQF